jgi:hypothetical protein
VTTGALLHCEVREVEAASVLGYTVMRRANVEVELKRERVAKPGTSDETRQRWRQRVWGWGSGFCDILACHE